jgi:SAM-dependent methyltransferase
VTEAQVLSRAESVGGAVDPRRLGIHRPTLTRDVPYVPTDHAVVMAMLRFAGVSASDVVYDLGCGDGRIVIAAAKHFGARGVGVDIDPLRIAESREAAAKARVGDRVRFDRQSFFQADLCEATVVMLYLLPGINIKLRPKLLAELRPGARIIANHFEIGDWRPDMSADVHHRILRQWIVPASVQGAWRCVVNDPAGRFHMRLSLKQRYQSVTGSARVGRSDLPIANGRLLGEHLTFKVIDWNNRGLAKWYSAQVQGGLLRGVCHVDCIEDTSIAWGGTRISAASL